MQFENRIRQEPSDAKRAQRRTESAHGYFLRIRSRDDKATDQLIRIGLDAAARRDIEELLRARGHLHLHDLVRPAILAEVGIATQGIKGGGAEEYFAIGKIGVGAYVRRGRAIRRSSAACPSLK